MTDWPQAPTHRRLFALVALVALLPVLAACAGLPAARMALPDPLARAPAETLSGLSGGPRGGFRLPGAEGRFERSATRLSLFDSLQRDRAAARYTLRWADGREAALDCIGRELSVAVGAVGGRLQPWTLRCRGAATLELADEGFVGAAGGTRSERRGRLELAGGGALDLRSVHRVQGSPLPLDAPIGYVVTQGGRPVGAIELNGGTPRLWRPASGDPLHEPVTLALLALALVWDPAG